SGWTFAPTALYIAAEVQSDETPNAIAVSGDTVERLVRALGMPDDPAPDVPDDRVPGVHDDPAPDVPEEEDAAPSERAPLLSPEVEIGVLELSEAVVEKVTRSLTEAPPVAFDIARKVRVYEPYIQYVEISLRGCAIQRHKLVVPRSIQGLEANTEVAGRLRT